MFFNKESKVVVEEFQSSIEEGLQSSQVAKLRSEYGYNEVEEQKKDSLLKRFIMQFKDATIIVLLVAAAVSIAVDPHEWIDSVIILVVVVFNAILGLVQESRAEKSLEALKKMSAPEAKVIRDGKKMSVPSRELVPGDIVVLESGDFVPADLRLLEVHNLKIDESALTGESEPVEKIETVINDDDVSLGDMKNCAFSSTNVTYGRGLGVVTGIGMNTEVGKIANLLLNEDSEATPLQVKLEQIGRTIGIICLIICLIVFGIEMMAGLDILEAFKTSVALAVAAVPEGLPTVVTIVLALGVQKMAKKNAIVRRLPAVETLGSASIVCSDKTGTLTQNKMTVVKTYRSETGVLDFDKGINDVKTEEMLGYFSLCSDAIIRYEDGNEVQIGDPTETALVIASNKAGHTKEDLLKEYHHKNELGFDSVRKMMTVVFEYKGEIISITKGAPDVILERCTNGDKKDLEANDVMAQDALRVLAVAVKKWKAVPEKMESDLLEVDMTFVGLVGMIDPPRPEVKAAIAEAKGAGIRTIMITGDHITTAIAIARDLGILEEGYKALSGTQLEKMTDIELIRDIEKYSVYARVAPEHKVRIVNAWQSQGHVVAMTGDGVNDSPALKTADIGCAMGITGTDVAKGAASMILTDDNFATIISAVREGRGIYDNIKKDVHFLLSSNIGEIVAIFCASLIGLFGSKELGVPLLPIHLLWVNLITDSLPAFALGLEPTESDIMERKPRPKNESFFAGGLSYSIGWQGVMIGALTLTSYLIGNSVNHESGMTMAFITLSISELFHAFNLKSKKSVFNKTIFNNMYLWGAFAFGLILQFVIIYIPFFSDIFKLVPLDFSHEMIALGLAASVIPIVEITKIFNKSK